MLTPLAASVPDSAALVQVHPAGIRHVRADGRELEWKPPKGKPVVQAAANARQVRYWGSRPELASKLRMLATSESPKYVCVAVLTWSSDLADLRYDRC